MKSHCRKKSLTFGEFIACDHDAWGERKTEGIVRPAILAHLVYAASAAS